MDYKEMINALMNVECKVSEAPKIIAVINQLTDKMMKEAQNGSDN